MNINKTNKELFKYLILIVLAFLFLLFFSNGTSPISKYYGSDSAFFMFFGKCMNKGLLPYIDLFDHKGPYLFWLEQLGQLIYEDRTGAFVLQIINLSLCMFIVDRIIYYVDNSICFKKRLLFQVPLAVIFAISFRDGNMCEEYCLCFLFLSLLILIKYFKEYENGNYKFNTINAFIYGLFFGIIVFIRITNSAFICSLVLTITILLIYKKEFKNLIMNGLMFILGFVVACLPVLLYYSSINALDVMLNAVFVYASKYANEWPMKYRLITYFTIENIVLIIPVFISIICLALNKKVKTKYFLFAVISSIATFIATFIGQSFTHYFVLTLPNVLFDIYLFLRFKKETENLIKNRLLVLLVSLLFMFQCFFAIEALGKNFLQIVDYSISEKESNYYSKQAKLDKEIGDYISDDEKNSVWGYGIKARFYIRSNTYPCIKYFDYLDQRLSYDEIKNEIEVLLHEKQPEWIVISKEKEIIPDFIKSELNDNYSLFAENEVYYLYNKNIDE